MTQKQKDKVMKRCEILSQVRSRELIGCSRIKSHKDNLLLSDIINALMLIII